MFQKEITGLNVRDIVLKVIIFLVENSRLSVIMFEIITK